MSYRCDYCDQPQPTHAKPARVVVQTRPKTYNLRNGNQTFGTEIVHEADLCITCESQFENTS